MLDDMLNDKITLSNEAGEIYATNVAAHVNNEKIQIHRKDLPITNGDRVCRRLPNGLTEYYQIEQHKFILSFDGDGYFFLTVKRLL